MLVAKLDFLQYIAVRSFSSNVGARLKAFWRRQIKGEDPNEIDQGKKKPRQDGISKERKKVEVHDGRMPNAAGSEFFSIC